MLRSLLILLASCSLVACMSYPRDPNAPGNEENPPGTPPGEEEPGPGNGPGVVPPPFDPRVTELALEIDYQPGAEPYVGPTLAGGDSWDLFDANAAALFPAGKTITVPDRLEAMEALAGVEDTVFSQQRIFELVAKHRNDASSEGRRAYYVLFLDGEFDTGDGQGNPNILGVSFGTTEVIAMFKPVIESAALDGETRRLVEQTTMIHEFGHAVGLVNNGVAMASPHQDEAHGAHCSNPDCVMYWLNHQDPGSVAEFAIRRVTGASTVVFDQACLDDAAAASAVVID